ncbi:ATP-binding cassette domain-containing protein [Streptomyces sp. NPDC094438]|uniref:ATP-binding cassette domain-containing protein n=1 Tax=Streptomyces sp. NPDC094438 TaxID=3366061 RepID=UPI003825BA8E
MGENGAGKSTLLHLLAGLEQPDEGEVVTVADGGAGLLAQTPQLPPDRTVGDAIGLALTELRTMERRLRDLEADLGAASPAGLGEYGDLLTAFELRGGYEADARVDKAMHALGLAETGRERTMGSLPGRRPGPGVGVGTCPQRPGAVAQAPGGPGRQAAGAAALRRPPGHTPGVGGIDGRGGADGPCGASRGHDHGRGYGIRSDTRGKGGEAEAVPGAGMGPEVRAQSGGRMAGRGEGGTGRGPAGGAGDGCGGRREGPGPRRQRGRQVDAAQGSGGTGGT